MKLKHRLDRLARALPVPATLTDEERYRRMVYLFSYSGTDPDMLRRRERMVGLIRKGRARREAAE